MSYEFKPMFPADVLLTRGDFAEDDEPATRAWLHRVRLAWRGLRTYRRRR